MGTWESASIAFLAAAEGTEQVELAAAMEGGPGQRRAAPAGIPGTGQDPDVRASRPRRQMKVDVPVVDVDGKDFVGQVLPGGVASPIRGRTLTSWPSLRTDLANAGATWVDEEVVICDNAPMS